MAGTGLVLSHPERGKTRTKMLMVLWADFGISSVDTLFSHRCKSKINYMRFGGDTDQRMIMDRQCDMAGKGWSVEVHQSEMSSVDN